ncbi:TetR/AcrR family transcriptional regulator [Amorphoplanes digitatis]|uniref:AcrR family transcriptional regulator n=1 Tax=Actinoplanes digitatis TaxID=1868 RepID=A0A7W7HU64_9ACTN|nr:TetR-like C-terminal domain-containing protein [Actinoplanes digitatis]MBB4760825.1 AcrR family transcriptional regulator [Actinoplanes digitatis]GID97971.1 putative TetR-family transcriptional regulator [Actinoplanes digitatis]
MAGYHHGNLRDAILAGAVSVIACDGVAALSLRALAADIGVSHTAFRRHFGSREGVLNTLAVQGNLMLAEQLSGAAAVGGFIDVGVAYVRFALANPGHFAVMFRSDLLDNDDPELISARAESLAPLRDGVRALGAADPTAAEVAAWGVVHGVATLALNGSLQATDVEALARRALSQFNPLR